MNVLVVSGGYSVYNAKGRLNGFLSYLIEQKLTELGHVVQNTDVAKKWNTERETKKLLWADSIIYVIPIMWFNTPSPFVEWFEQILQYKKTFVITDDYGEGGLVPANSFMMVASTNMKKEDFEKGFVLNGIKNIDDILKPLELTNYYLSIRNKLPTFHADNVIEGSTQWIENAILSHIQESYSFEKR